MLKKLFNKKYIISGIIILLVTFFGFCDISYAQSFVASWYGDNYNTSNAACAAHGRVCDGNCSNLTKGGATYCRDTAEYEGISWKSGIYGYVDGITPLTAFTGTTGTIACASIGRSCYGSYTHNGSQQITGCNVSMNWGGALCDNPPKGVGYPWVNTNTTGDAICTNLGRNSPGNTGCFGTYSYSGGAVTGCGNTFNWGAAICNFDCSDNDGGAIVGISGYTVGHDDVGHTDSCSGDNLTEWYCVGDNAVSTSYRCPYGCLKGVCKVETVTNGACNPVTNGQSFYSKSETDANMCSSGTVSNFSGTGSWEWDCVGSGAGHTNASCSATLKIDGVCGVAAKSYYATGVPATEPTALVGLLCGAGSMAPTPAIPGFPIVGGPKTWTCGGANGGSNSPICSAVLVPKLVNTRTYSDIDTVMEIDNMEYASSDNAKTAYVGGSYGNTGGTITTTPDGLYKVHKFNSSGTFTSSNSGNVEVLVVAGGGGGGGSPLAGGGGGGGFLSAPNYNITSGQQITVVVGSGGAGGWGQRIAPWNGDIGGTGGNSIFGTLTAFGGGGGGRYNGVAATNGGSGGGAGYAGNIGSGTAGPPRQGYNGGTSNTTALNFGAGGGGGAGAVGSNGTTIAGGKGGDGLSSLISGTLTWYSGGGGGSIYFSGTVGGGGLGGGGAGSLGDGVSGTVNTGGGGGGAERAGTTGSGGNGGSGVVIVKAKASDFQSVLVNTEPTIKNGTGSYSLKVVAKAGASAGKTLTRTLATPLDLKDVNALSFDIYSSRTGSNVSIGIHDTDGTTTLITPNITNINSWQTITWNISGVPNINKDNIDKIIITIEDASADNTFYIDNFHAIIPGVTPATSVFRGAMCSTPGNPTPFSPSFPSVASTPTPYQTTWTCPSINNGEKSPTCTAKLLGGTDGVCGTAAKDYASSDSSFLGSMCGYDAWYSGGAAWGYRVKVTINASQVPSTQTNFPVYVNLANLPAGFWSSVKADGSDIRVTNSAGTELPREIESINTGTSAGVLWFGANSISNESYYYIYYGNASATEPAASATYGKNDVWDSNFKGVWHLPSIITLTANDSTSNGNNGTNNGVTASVGKVGGAGIFNGISNYINLPVSLSAPIGAVNYRGSVSFWAKSGGGTPISIYRTGEAQGGHAYLTISGNTFRYTNCDLNGPPWCTNILSTTSFTPSDWNYFVFTSDANNHYQISVNGVVTPITKTFQTIPGSYTQIMMGFMHNYVWGDYYFSGLLDDIKVSNSVRSADWIATEYNNQSNPSSFYQVSAQEIFTSSVGGAVTYVSGSGFPALGATTTWTCGGFGTGGPSPICRATRASPILPVNLTANLNNCGGNDYATVDLQWGYSGASVQTKSHYQISIASDFSSILKEGDILFSGNYVQPVVSGASIIGNLSFNTKYYWRVKVSDAGGDSEYVNGNFFTTPVHAYPYADFTFTPTSPLIKQQVNLTANSSKCFDNNGNVIPCATVVNGYTPYAWILDDNTTKTEISFSRTWQNDGLYTQKLTVCDNTPVTPQCCFVEKIIEVKNPANVPEWREISPF